MKNLGILLMLVTPITVVSQSRADGVVLNGVSPRSIGRGGTNLGHFDNGGVIHDNPAGMVNTSGSGLIDIGVDVLFTDFGYSDPDNTGGVSDQNATPLPQISMIRKSADGKWAYGLGIFMPAGFSESYDMNGPTPLVGPRHYESFGALAKVLPALAWKPTDRLSVGGTIGVGINHTELEGPYFIQSGPFTGFPTIVDLQGTGATMTWSLGCQYELTERTNLGLAYQSESRFRLDGPATVEIPGLGSSRYDADIRITWPRSFGAGLRHELTENQTFSVDVIWFDWSSAFNNIGVELSDPETTGFPEISDRLPLDWNDSVSVRLGHEIDLAELGTFRCGYVYHNNPIPEGTLTPFIQAMMEHGFSVGYGFKYLGCEIDTSYAFTFGSDVRVGTSDLVGGDFDNSKHSAKTHAVAVSVIKRY